MKDTAATVAVIPPARPENALLSAPILPTLLRLTLPNLAAMLVTALVAICETVYVGILGTTPLAAIALVFPMIMLMQMLSAGAMGGGVSSAISRALGAGDVVRAKSLAVHAVVIGATAGLVFSVIFVAFGAPDLPRARRLGPVLAEALAYANVALAGPSRSGWSIRWPPSCGAPATCACRRSHCLPRPCCRSCSGAAWGWVSAQFLGSA